MKYEFHELSNIFPLLEGEQLEQLKEDIREHGLLQSIVLFEGKILDGRNRYLACSELKIDPKIEQYMGNKPLEYVISENLKRRHLTPDQRAAIADTVMPMLEEEARKRQSTHKKGDIYLPQKIGEGKRKDRESAVKASKIFNVNPEYIRTIKKLRETGKQDKIEAIKQGKITLVKIKKEARLEKIKTQRANIEKNVLAKPEGKFDVIVIDPPWRYDGDIFPEQKDLLPSYEANGNRGTTPYPTMSLKEIKEIKLPAEKDCVLWLWTTNLFLHESFHLLDNWGFEFKCVLTWDKIHFGTGRWLRSQTEHCLLAIKGKPFFDNKKYSTLLREKRTTHSTKPEAFYKMVEEICAGKKLDYFSRKKRKGWESYGDEC